MTQILIIDDEKTDCALFSRKLEKEGYSVLTANNSKDAFLALSQQTNMNAVLLDLNLIGENGLEIQSEIKNTYPDLPVIMMTGRNDAAGRAKGLKMGADDYIIKSNCMDELLIRLQRILEIENTIPALIFNDYMHDVSNANGEFAKLSTIQYQVLKAMAFSKGKTITRNQIQKIIGNDDTVNTDKAIELMILKIRKKLGCTPQNPKHIKTIRGKGYSFIGTIGK